MFSAIEGTYKRTATSRLETISATTLTSSWLKMGKKPLFYLFAIVAVVVIYKFNNF